MVILVGGLTMHIWCQCISYTLVDFGNGRLEHDDEDDELFVCQLVGVDGVEDG